MNLNIFRKGARVDRASFWVLVLILCLAKAAVFQIGTMNPTVSFLSALDMIVIIAIAATVAARFRDIGWPIWIGVTLVLLCMIVVPFGAFAVVGLGAKVDLLAVMNAVTILTMAVITALVVLAGCVKSRPAPAA